MTKTHATFDAKEKKTEIIKTDFSDCFEIIPGDYTSEKIAHTYKGISAEFAAYSTIFKTINPKVCLDVGSNIGSHALFFAKHCEYVYAFEPNPYIYSILQRNIERNASNIISFPFGLSDNTSEKDFYIDHEHTGCSSFVVENASEGAQLILTHVTTGDEVIAKENITHIDFIKIDAEGYEVNILLGLKQCISQHKPVIALEWNAASTRIGFKKRDLFREFFSDYLCFGLESPWHKHLYPTMLSRIKRGIVKNLLKRKRPLTAQKFVPGCSYGIVFFIPEHFRHVIHDFSFLPTGYTPAVGVIA